MHRPARNLFLPPLLPRPIIDHVPRRIHVPTLHPGEILLDESQAHHLRDVLRLKIGSSVELFDDAGALAEAIVVRTDASGVSVRVEEIRKAQASSALIIASAIPKGDRADWMVEKLSELGVTRFIPLKTERSVVHPTGPSKRERWIRIATEAAKQSKRAGVMQIDELTDVGKLLTPSPCIQGEGGGEGSPHSIQNPQSKIENRMHPLPTPLPEYREREGVAWYLSTRADAKPASELAGSCKRLTLFIGPEGGWTDEEIATFGRARLDGG